MKSRLPSAWSQSFDFWKKVFNHLRSRTLILLMQAFFVGCIPVIGLGHVNAFLLADHHERPEFVDFDHLRYIRL